MTNDSSTVHKSADMILVDDLDRAALTLTPALSALGILERMFSAIPPEYEFSPREVAVLLRTVNLAAAQGWPL